MTPVAFSVAFQPIVAPATRNVFAYEALVRGPRGEPARSVLERLDPLDRYAFDANVHRRAVALATGLTPEMQLTLNCLPGALQSEDYGIEGTIAWAARHGLSAEQLVLEITEEEAIVDRATFARRIDHCRALGVGIAIDDFGAGYAGLSMLADFLPDILKLDMQLVRGVDHLGPRQSIVRATLQVSLDLGIDVVAEGVESAEEYRWLADAGIGLFQGYYFARPAFERLDAWPSATGPRPD